MKHRFGPGFAVLLALASAAHAERLPWSVYDSSDGLAGDAIRDLLQDRDGFLWIATSSGLSRFDGVAFESYDTAEGLPSPRIESLAETPDGSLWAATTHGLARMRPDATGPAPFVVEPLPAPFERGTVERLFVDHSGSLWASFVGGVVRFAPDAAGTFRATTIDKPPEVGPVASFAESADGTLWMGAEGGLVRRSADGDLVVLRLGGAVAGTRTQYAEGIADLAVDRAGRLWIAGSGVVTAWMPPATAAADASPLLASARWARFAGDLPAAPGEAVAYGTAQDLPTPLVNRLVAGRDALWAVTREGVLAISASGTRRIGVAQGLVEAFESSAIEDADGALWLGSESRGISRLLRSGFVSYDEADGLAGDRAAQLFEAPPGELYAVTWSRDLHRFDGRRFEQLTPRALFPRFARAWGWNQLALFDRRGRLWYPTASGLFRFAAVDDVRALVGSSPERHWSRGSSLLAGDDIFRLYEDRRGDVWVSLIAMPCLVRFVGGESPQTVTEVEPCEQWGAPTAFAEDGAGDLWVGFYLGGLARVRDGQWRFFGEADGLPPGFVSDLLVDRAGALWMSTTAGGVARIERPESDAPGVRRWTSADGLTTDSARCLAEAPDGRMFVGSSRGVDRLDPATGGVRSYSTADGLPNNLVFVCHATGDGDLWFGTLHGLARYLPAAEESERPPRLLLGGLEIAGVPQPLAARGVASVAPLELRRDQRSLQVDLVGVALAAGVNLRYQYRVLGADDAWSAPSPARRVQLAALAPGRYRFEARATTQEGKSSPVVGFDFRLPPPLWQRPWFVASFVLLALAAATLLSRLRTARLVAVERARTRIASDLHDDVGSSVSRIGVLGELARRRLHDDPAAAEAILADIGGEASELAEATSDIVWSIDPRRDDLGSLAVRLRRFAADLLEAQGIGLEWSSPADADAIALTPEVRRALYLTLKEAIHNIAKHSQAARATVRIVAEGAVIRAEVVDDGRGIDPARAAAAAAEGRQGLGGMVARAAGVGGEATIAAAPGGGTRVALRFPAGRGTPHRHAIRRRTGD
ncbi:MAG: two-component regulator propeller domain-containing protein [Thermoanaerobaculia bacterium]